MLSTCTHEKERGRGGQLMPSRESQLASADVLEFNSNSICNSITTYMDQSQDGVHI